MRGFNKSIDQLSDAIGTKKEKALKGVLKSEENTEQWEWRRYASSSNWI